MKVGSFVLYVTINRMVFYLWEKPEFAFQIQIEENLTLGRWTLVFYWLISYTIDMELIDQACDWFECVKTRRINLINVNQNKLCICDILWAQTGGKTHTLKIICFLSEQSILVTSIYFWSVALNCPLDLRLNQENLYDAVPILFSARGKRTRKQ